MHYIDAANVNEYLLFVASVRFNPNDHKILWCPVRLNQCLIYRQRRILAEKFAGNRLTERLINKVIHRSWGENSMKIFLDLLTHTSRSSSNFFLLVRGGTIENYLRNGWLRQCGVYFAGTGGVEAAERMASAMSRLIVANARLCAATIVS